MTQRFKLKHLNITLPKVADEYNVAGSKSVIALDIKTKIQFHEENGSIFHEYNFHSDRHIQNCGGYIDKLIKYRSKKIKDAVGKMILADKPLDQLPSLLKSRSILVDMFLSKMIAIFLKGKKSDRAKLFDHGCTIAEHYEMIDQMLASICGKTAADCISYFGVDISPLALSAAKMLHPNAPSDHFHLALAEGSDITLPANSVDFSLSIGVVNHVANPPLALDRLIDITRCGLVHVLWVTGESEGFWVTNHAGFPNYFFSVKDLALLARRYADKGSFYYADFTPESSSSQPNSYIGISEKRMNLLGSYTLVFCGKDYVVEGLNSINFSEMK